MEKITKNNPKILTHFLARRVFVQTLISFDRRFFLAINGWYVKELTFGGDPHLNAYYTPASDPDIKCESQPS